MRLKVFFVSLLVLAQARTVSSKPSDGALFTLQVASFSESESAEALVVELGAQGVKAKCFSVNLPSRGVWTRVLVGSFKTPSSARQYGNLLVARHAVREFIVWRIEELEGLSRARQVFRGESPPSEGARVTSNALPVETGSPRYSPVSAPLPTAAPLRNGLPPRVDQATVPTPDPVQVAFGLVMGPRDVGSDSHRGGLWLSGDIEEGLARLEWIAGLKSNRLLAVESDGKVRLDTTSLAKSAGVKNLDGAAGSVVLADFITSNEGLMLLVELTQGQKRYGLHIGHSAPTAGGPAKVTGSVNLDNNFDSRINPYRRLGKKLDHERPPNGIEDLVAINPEARWFNLPTGRIVPPGNVTFHELAEAHAKIALGLDYLARAERPGAHDIAIEREKRLQKQRPGADIVLTVGSNRVLQSDRELREFRGAAASIARQQ